jgi:glycosyltransferase involved in cell wall biosynthesis
VERWARELVERLPAIDPGLYRVLAPPPRLAHRAGHAWEQAVLPARARRMGAAAIVSPANLAPVWWASNVVVIHDAVALAHPEWFSRAYVASQRALMPRIAGRALRVVTVSQFSRDEVVRLMGAPRDRVRVVPGGVDARFHPDADAEAARRALGLERPYVLTVSARGARKNAPALGETARRLRTHGVDLVAAGGTRPHLLAEGAEGARETGYVPDELLPGLYAGAEAFVLPSLHEGFGLTALEAMAAGVPVVASNRTALPETVDKAGVLVDPDDHEAIADAVEALLADDGERARLRAAGLERAAGFTWERTARELHAVVGEVT